MLQVGLGIAASVEPESEGLAVRQLPGHVDGEGQQVRGQKSAAELADRVCLLEFRGAEVDEVCDLAGFESASVMTENQFSVAHLHRGNQTPVSVRDVPGVLEKFPDPARKDARAVGLQRPEVFVHTLCRVGREGLGFLLVPVVRRRSVVANRSGIRPHGQRPRTRCARCSRDVVVCGSLRDCGGEERRVYDGV